MSGGYGLVQWTPASKYINWVSGDASTMDNNLSRIQYEINNNVQWIPTSQYNYSFKTFTTSTDTPENLASAFLKNYERAGVEVEQTRRSNARYWYSFLSGEDPTPPTPSFSKKSKFKWVLYANKIRNRLTNK